MKTDIKISPINYDNVVQRNWSVISSAFKEHLLNILDEFEQKELTFTCGVKAMDLLQSLPLYTALFTSHYLSLSTCTIWLELDFALHSKTIKCGEVLIMQE